jgi:hypothetical protein
MRKWTTFPFSRLLALTLLVLSAMATPAFAAKLLTIDQMEDLLGRLHGKSDSKVASDLDEVQLTERVTPSRLARWESQFPGPRVHEEMMRLADLSAFQKADIDDLLRDPAPDEDTQEQILALASHSIHAAALAHLPDFSASRNTTHFDGSTTQRIDSSTASPSGTPAKEHLSLSSLSLKRTGNDNSGEIEELHSAGQAGTTVTYRDGQEIVDTESEKHAQPDFGLTPDSAFGPTLADIVGDALQNKISWLRWEQGAVEPEAVFQFSVPEDKSHFRVTITEGGKTVALTPAYHGEIEVDPGTGEILRFSEIADMAPPRQAMRAAIMVEFAPVTFGKRICICPLHGVAFSRFPVPNAASGAPAPFETKLNDVFFADYRSITLP